jgi:hypothetical protein
MTATVTPSATDTRAMVFFIGLLTDSGWQAVQSRRKGLSARLLPRRLTQGGAAGKP